MVMTVCAIFVSCLGIMTNHKLGLSSSVATNKMTVAVTELGKTISDSIIGIFQLFGWPSSSVNLLSLDGILAVAAAVVSIGVISLFLLLCNICIRKEHRQISGQQQAYIAIVFFAFLVNEMLFCLVDLNYSDAVCEYRYWLMVIIPLFVGIGILYDWAKKYINGNYVISITMFLVLLLSSITVVKDMRMWKQNNGADIYENIMNTIAEQEIDTVFVYGDYFSSRVITAFVEEDMEAFAVCNTGIDDTGSVWQDGFRMPKWGTFVKYDVDVLQQTEIKKCGLLIDKANAQQDYIYFLSQASEAIPFEGTSYELLVLNNWKMDMQMGVPEGDVKESRDDFYGNYTREHITITEDGYFVSDGTKGTLVEGDFVASEEGVYEVELSYKMSGSAKLQVEVATDVDGEAVFYETDLAENSSLAVIRDMYLREGDTYRICISEEDNTVLQLENIRYRRQK